MLPGRVGQSCWQKGRHMKKHLTVKELPDSEKPYEKFLKSGAVALSDAELLAVIIRCGTNGKKSVDVAQDFLNYGNRNLLNLYETSYEDMLRIPGIGQVKAIQLKCIAELSRRIAEAKYQHLVCLSSAQSVADYYMERMRHEKQEKLLIAMFDMKCRLLGDVLLSVGSATSTFVPPREIFLTALRYQAVQIIMVHNHPSGSPVPSAADNAVTKRVEECGAILGIPLSDHIIIGDHTYYSYKEQGLIS